MGATNFQCEWEGTDYREGFNQLSADAEAEYGWDAYNGTISTTGLSSERPIVVAKRYNKTAQNKALKEIEKREWGRKRVCSVIDAGIVGYEISAYQKVPHTSADATFQTFYVAYADRKPLGMFKTAAEARKCLEKAITRANGNVDCYHVEKESHPTQKNPKTCTVAYERKVRRTKTKPSRIPAGTIVKEVHHYFFYGWAAE